MQTTRSSSIMRALVVSVAASIVGGILIGAVMGVWIASLNSVPTLGETAILAGHLSVLYFFVTLPVMLGGLLLVALIGVRPTWRMSIAVFLAWYVVVNATTRFISSVQFISVLPHVSFVGALDLLVVGFAALAIAWGVSTRHSALGVAATVGLLGVLQLFHQYHETPRQLDISSWVVEGKETVSAFGTADPSQQFTNAKLGVLGLDGLSWEVLVPLLKSGALPNFQKLIEGAAIGHLATNSYSRSPALWESISTGKGPLGHGVADHYHYEFPGVSTRIGHLPRFPMSNSVMGINRLLAATVGRGPWSMVFSSSVDARSTRFWEVANRAGMPVGIYGWYNTTPAAPVLGFLSGRGYTDPRYFPLDLEKDMARLKTAPLQLGVVWVDEDIPTEAEHLDRFVGHALAHEPALLAYYTHFADGVNHINWNETAHGGSFFFSGLRDFDLVPGPAETKVMQFLDSQLGEYMSRLPEDAAFILVSDHGFDFRGYEHDNAPAGVIIARGKDIAPGIVAGANLTDIAPTILHVLGLAVGEDMEGRPIALARKGSALDRAPTFVASHGPPTPPIDEEQMTADDAQQHDDYLRALGYVQ